MIYHRLLKKSTLRRVQKMRIKYRLRGGWLLTAEGNRIRGYTDRENRINRAKLMQMRAHRRDQIVDVFFQEDPSLGGFTRDFWDGEPVNTPSILTG